MAATEDSSLPFPVSEYPPEITGVVFPIAKAIRTHSESGESLSILVFFANGFGLVPIFFLIGMGMLLNREDTNSGPPCLLVTAITGCILALSLATWFIWRMRGASLGYSFYRRFRAAFPPGSPRRAEAEEALGHCLLPTDGRFYLYVTDRELGAPSDLWERAVGSHEPAVYRVQRWCLFLAIVAAWYACLRYVPVAMAERWLRSQAEAALEDASRTGDRPLPDDSCWGQIVVWDVVERTRSELERELPEEMLAEPGELPVTFILLTVKRDSEKNPQAPARADVVSQPGNGALGYRVMPRSQVVSWLRSHYVPPPPPPPD